MLIINTSVAKISKLLAINIGFIACGIWLITSSRSGDEAYFAGWLCLVVFGIFLLLSIPIVFSKKPLARLDENGITLSNYGLIPWSDIKEVTATDKLASLWVDNENIYIERLSPLSRLVARGNQKCGFSPVFIPLALIANDQKTLLIEGIRNKIPPRLHP